MLIEGAIYFGPERYNARSAAIFVRIYTDKSKDLSDYGANGIYITASISWNSPKFVGWAGKRSQSFAKTIWCVQRFRCTYQIVPPGQGRKTPFCSAFVALQDNNEVSKQ
jgi:hypothetical protein